MGKHDAPGLDQADRKILDIIQSDFPLASRPYAVVGERLGLSEMEVMERVRKMRQEGVIRRMGANFQSSRLGFFSTLCAAKVPEALKEDFITAVNAIPGVTHNYERDHEYNIWFTLIAETPEMAGRILDDLQLRTGVGILNLPASDFYKIRVEFAMR